MDQHPPPTSSGSSQRTQSIRLGSNSPFVLMNFTQSQIWEAPDHELIWALHEIKKELAFRAIAKGQDEDEMMDIDTPIAEFMGG